MTFGLLVEVEHDLDHACSSYTRAPYCAYQAQFMGRKTIDEIKKVDRLDPCQSA